MATQKKTKKVSPKKKSPAKPIKKSKSVIKEKRILVTGGAGYIGSHTVRLMADAGEKIVVLDNLVYGHKEAIVNPDVVLIQGDLGDEKTLLKIFNRFEISAVVHFAAWTYVGESVAEPSKYYRNNTAAPIVLLDVMRKFGTKFFIFSSTAATYGEPQYSPMDEKHQNKPLSPYGMSKYFLEKVLEDYDKAYGIKSVRLRYFNASGASLDAKIGEDHDPETHLIPLVLMAATGERKNITVFGTDYPTADGTCIRDYIHILDLARAHAKGLEYLKNGGASISLNLGTGVGHSVKEVISVCETVCGKKVPVVFGDRRPGDPPSLVANPALAETVLGWKAEFTDLSSVVETAWKWMSGPRKGRYPAKTKKK